MVGENNSTQLIYFYYRVKELKRRQEERVTSVTIMKKREGGLKSKIEKLKNKNKNL